MLSLSTLEEIFKKYHLTYLALQLFLQQGTFQHVATLQSDTVNSVLNTKRCELHVCQVRAVFIRIHHCVCCGEWPYCLVCVSCKDILNDVLHTSQLCVCVFACTSYKVKNLFLWLMCFLWLTSYRHLVIALALLQLVCLPHYCYHSQEITGSGFVIVCIGLAFM